MHGSMPSFDYKALSVGRKAVRNLIDWDDCEDKCVVCDEDTWDSKNHRIHDPVCVIGAVVRAFKDAI